MHSLLFLFCNLIQRKQYLFLIEKNCYCYSFGIEQIIVLGMDFKESLRVSVG